MWRRSVASRRQAHRTVRAEDRAATGFSTSRSGPYLVCRLFTALRFFYERGLLMRTPLEDAARDEFTRRVRRRTRWAVSIRSSTCRHRPGLHVDGRLRPRVSTPATSSPPTLYAEPNVSAGTTNSRMDLACSFDRAARRRVEEPGRTRPADTGAGRAPLPPERDQPSHRRRPRLQRRAAGGAPTPPTPSRELATASSPCTVPTGRPRTFLSSGMTTDQTDRLWTLPEWPSRFGVLGRSYGNTADIRPAPATLGRRACRSWSHRWR